MMEKEKTDSPSKAMGRDEELASIVEISFSNDEAGPQDGFGEFFAEPRPLRPRESDFEDNERGTLLPNLWHADHE